MTNLCGINVTIFGNPNLPSSGNFLAFCQNGTGECTNSNSVESRNTSTTQLGEAFPNPAQTELFIPYKLDESVTSTQLVIRNVMGTMVAVHQLAEGQQQLPINIAALPVGTYSYSLVMDEKVVATKRFVKL